jgi:hypothetical protein
MSRDWLLVWAEALAARVPDGAKIAVPHGAWPCVFPDAA